MENQQDNPIKKRKSVNIILIGLTVITFFGMTIWEKLGADDAFYGNTTGFLLYHGALYAPKVLQEGEVYRLVTYLFLHGGIEHLISNMLILYFVGTIVEDYFGSLRFAILYFCSGILAGIGSVVYNGFIQTGTITWEALSEAMRYPVCVGASGAVFGITGAMTYLVIKYQGKLEGITLQRFLVFLGLSILGGITDSGIDHAAHFTGLAAGFLLALLIRKPKNSKLYEEK